MGRCQAGAGLLRPGGGAAGAAPDRIAYVGDRLDNDAEPAAAAGLRPVFIPRGLWGRLHDAWPRAALRIESLLELPAMALSARWAS
jgi:FMN phosphatase YigB (HAD superfamily)